MRCSDRWLHGVLFDCNYYAFRESSRNGGIFSLDTVITMRSPSRLLSGLNRYCLDPGYWFIKLRALCGLAWDLKISSEERMKAKPVKTAG